MYKTGESIQKIKIGGGVRNSGIELFRIITMLVIVAHHYVVNSGLTVECIPQNPLASRSIFLLLFGWGGKTGINCFVLITGYFMCTSKITVRKFLKLLLWIEFYKVIFYMIFTLSGYQPFSVVSMIKYLSPITSIATGFSSAYLVFYLFIPFLNILIKAMDKKQHMLLIILCVCVYSILPCLFIEVQFNYVTWFCVIYIIGSYIRLYPEKWFDSSEICGCLAITSLLLSWLSVITLNWFGNKFLGMNLNRFFVSDSNKPLALVTAVCSFMYFKNIHIGHSKFINTVAASSYGVLLIHANSDTMRQWLWRDTLNNVGMYNSNILVVHAFASVVCIYAICTIIDMMRIKFIEKPFFRFLDNKKILK